MPSGVVTHIVCDHPVATRGRVREDGARVPESPFDGGSGVRTAPSAAVVLSTTVEREFGSLSGGIRNHGHQHRGCG